MDEHTRLEVEAAGRKIVAQSLEDFAAAREDLLRAFMAEAGIDPALYELQAITHPAAFDAPSEDYRELNVFVPAADLRFYEGRPLTPEFFRELRERYPSLQLTGHPVLMSRIVTPKGGGLG